MYTAAAKNVGHPADVSITFEIKFSPPSRDVPGPKSLYNVFIQCSSHIVRQETLKFLPLCFTSSSAN